MKEDIKRQKVITNIIIAVGRVLLCLKNENIAKKVINKQLK